MILALSYTALLGALARGELRWDELGSCLFAFGCTSGHVFEACPMEAGWFFGKGEDEPAMSAEQAAARVAEAVRAAAGRVIWTRDAHDPYTTSEKEYAALSQFVESHGIPAPARPRGESWRDAPERFDFAREARQAGVRVISGC